jgi:hypothetical protein
MIRSLWFPATVLLIVGLWGYTRFAPRPRDEPAMPDAASGEDSRPLYFVPGGKYTAADIEANGRTTASEKYRGFRSNHDFAPAPGDRVCPVTRTKADPRCTWTVNGTVYQFCCPPCIDEFVRTAKERPDHIREPGAYVRR